MITLDLTNFKITYKEALAKLWEVVNAQRG